MSAIEFGFQEVISEIAAIARIAEAYLAPTSQFVLPQLRTELENIQSATTDGTWQWGIKNHQPLVTRVSRGDYQPNSQGEHNVFAEVTSVWEVRRIRPAGKKTKPADRFALDGLASTRVRIFKELPQGGKEQIAMWRMEVGDDASPGCHFHVQVLGEDEAGPFPHSLDVPRLPGLISTPTAVIEFVLAELFQDDWPKHLATRAADVNRWGPIQKRRLGAILDWQRGVVEKAPTSPWSTLKSSRPPSSLFIADAS